MFVIDDEGRVVREPSCLVDRLFAGPFGDAGRGDLVVDAPAHVLLPRLATIGPPGVLVGLVVQAPEDVDEAQLVEYAREPLALFGQEARVLLIGAPVPQVDLLLRDIPVSAQDEFMVSFLEALEVRQERLRSEENTSELQSP